MVRSASLLATSLGGVLAFPGFPSWGGADQYSVHVNLTASDVVPTGAEWGFAYYYVSDHAKNATYSRYDHAKGQRDEVCNGIHANTDRPCTTIHATDGWMYMAFPATATDAASCCKCSQHIGAVRSDWLQDGGGSYAGPTTVGGQAVDEFLKQGASDNHYYCSTDAAQKPVRYMEHKNGKLKQWDFDLATYQVGDPGADKFAPPADCTTRCRASLCLF